MISRIAMTVLALAVVGTASLAVLDSADAQSRQGWRQGGFSAAEKNLFDRASRVHDGAGF